MVLLHTLVFKVELDQRKQGGWMPCPDSYRKVQDKPKEAVIEVANKS
jgi:hypothetical protein